MSTANIKVRAFAKLEQTVTCFAIKMEVNVR
jgi:hypothetical protein